MPTSDELKKQREIINQLEQEILRDVQEKAELLGFTLVAKGTIPHTPRKVKYRNPDNHEETYSRGKYPKWLKAKIAAGATLDDFAVKA